MAPVSGSWVGGDLDQGPRGGGDAESLASRAMSVGVEQQIIEVSVEVTGVKQVGVFAFARQVRPIEQHHSIARA